MNQQQHGARSPLEQALAAVSEALRAMSYGTILLTIHESKIVQLEVTEKRRFGH